MKTKIITAHEEEFSSENVSKKIIGVLTNLNENGYRIDSFPYIFNESNNTYIFFNTIIDLNDYLLYGDMKTKRSYMKESKFDDFYDNGVVGMFSEYLNWDD